MLQNRLFGYFKASITKMKLDGMHRIKFWKIVNFWNDTQNWIHSQKSNWFSPDELFVKTGAFWEEMINTKTFEFFLKFVILGFLKLRSPKRSPQNCQNIGDYLKNLKISCFLDLQLWISFETSFSSFELKKKTMCVFRHT